MFGAGDMFGFGFGHLLWWGLLIVAAILMVRWLARGSESAEGAELRVARCRS